MHAGEIIGLMGGSQIRKTNGGDLILRSASHSFHMPYHFNIRKPAEFLPETVLFPHVGLLPSLFPLESKKGAYTLYLHVNDFVLMHISCGYRSKKCGCFGRWLRI